MSYHDDEGDDGERDPFDLSGAGFADPRVAAAVAAMGARRAAPRIPEPARPVGLRTKPCLPGEKAWATAQLDPGGATCFVTDLDVARQSAREWVVLAVRADRRELLADDAGIPADVFAPDAYHPTLDNPRCSVFAVEALRLAIAPPPPWKRALGALRVDALAGPLGRAGRWLAPPPPRDDEDEDEKDEDEPLRRAADPSLLARLSRRALAAAAALRRAADWRWRQSPGPVPFYATAWYLRAPEGLDCLERPR